MQCVAFAIPYIYVYIAYIHKDIMLVIRCSMFLVRFGCCAVVAVVAVAVAVSIKRHLNHESS